MHLMERCEAVLHAYIHVINKYLIIVILKFIIPSHFVKLYLSTVYNVQYKYEFIILIYNVISLSHC